MITLPPMHRLQRMAPTMPGIQDLPAQIHRALDEAQLDSERLSGKSIALTVGSRGIASLQITVQAACDWLKKQGASPFVVPAMGSHGGATEEGQRTVLKDYGVTEERIGAPVRSSMKTVHLGDTPEGYAVYMDRNAHEADGVLLFNRVKPHTNFNGKIESGLVKIMTVGLGKEEGAKVVHLGSRQADYEPVLRSMAEVVLGSGKIVGGFGVVENEEHQVAVVRAARPGTIITMEEQALETAKELYARLPFKNIGLLIVDEMGKDISGAGMDTKVVGRGWVAGGEGMPEIRLVYVRDVTPASEGNAIGMGYADLIHENLYRKLDMEKVYVNARTSLEPGGARMPMHFPTDARAIGFALESMGCTDIARERIVWIKNTLMLREILVSPGILPELPSDSGYREVPTSLNADLGGNGNLPSVWNGKAPTA